MQPKSKLCPSGLSQKLSPMLLEDQHIVGGEIVAQGKVLLQSDDRLLSTGLWECSTGEFDWKFSWDEFANVIEGEATVTEEGGRQYTLRAGDTVHFPRGMKTRWRVIKPLRKLFFIRTPEPLRVETC